MDTTTVRVKRSTRDLLTRYGDEQDKTADEVIRAGLVALEREAIRKRAEYDAARLARDPAYLAEMTSPEVV